MKNANLNDSIMQQATRFLFTFLGKRENAPFTMSFILVFFLAAWNVWQQKERAVENYNWRELIAQKDSADRKARLILYDRLNAQNTEILLCKSRQEWLETEITALKKALNKRR